MSPSPGARPAARPRIPAEWYRPSAPWTVAFLLYAPCLVAVPAGASYLVWMQPLSWPLKVLVMLPLTVLAGYGYQLMGFVGHEGLHLSLHRNKLVSAVIGLFYASSVVSYFEMGFAAQHWSHHRFTNQASDPDIPPVAHLTTWWQRLLFARATYNLRYIRITALLALERPWPFPYRMPFARRTIARLARLNFLFASMWLAFYVALAIVNPVLTLIAVVLPMLTALLISGCQTFLDHAGVGDELYANAWSRTSWFMTAVYFGANYHLEHHLYPGMPCYRLHKVARLLREMGAVEPRTAPAQPSFLRAYRTVAAPYVAATSDRTFDPFTRETLDHAGQDR